MANSPSPNPRAGIDLGGTKIQSVIVGVDGTVLGSERRPTPTEGGPGAIVSALAESVRAAAAAAQCEVPARVGVGTPGSVDANRATVTGARNLCGFDGAVPLAALLGEALGGQVVLGNDVGVALDAETALGAGADLASFVGLWWGTGIGGGVVLGGKRWVGRGAGGEIGHLVVKIGGRRCPCGRRGCVEAYAGRRAMEAHARKLHESGRKSKLFHIARKKKKDHLTSSVWDKALRQGDEVATDLIEQAVRALAAGAASAVNLLDVEGVIVGGGLGTRLGELYTAKIAEAMVPHLFRAERPPHVRLSKLGDLGGAIGAALL
jgi:glucokinase